jgi:hypothetical protein
MSEDTMISSHKAPPRPDVSPDTTRPCVRCALHYRPSLLYRMFMGAHADECLAEDVRRYDIDPITGKTRLNRPADCAVARGAHGLCGPKGKHFTRSRAKEDR